MRLLARLVATTGLLFAGLAAPLTAASVWVEGENPTESSCDPHPWWYDQVKTDVLSGGAWHSNWSEEVGVAEYAIEIPEDGTYDLWLRANPTQARMSFRVDDGEWRAIDWSRGQRGHMNIAADNKPDLRFIAWCKPAELELTAGAHTIAFRYHSGNNNHGAIDCFCLDNGSFIPSGTTRPGEQAGGRSEPAPPEQAIWIEGEVPDASSFQAHNWYDSVKKDVFSGREWLEHFSNDTAATASWDFEVLVADEYDLWIRANPVKAALEWRLDGGDWQAVDFGDARGQMNIAANNAPDLRFIAWIKLGEPELAVGAHTIEVRVGRNNGPFHAGIDAIALVRMPWVPSGATRPSIQTGTAGPADWFPVVADVDEFSEDSVIDMSELVPAPAGQFGHVIADGGDLRFAETGEAVKFWALGSNLSDTTSEEEMRQRARWYRKHGVNLVRQHTVIGDVGLLREDGTFDPERLDRYDRWFAILKEHGIYSTWSVIYPHHGRFVREGDVSREIFEALRARDDHPRDGAVVSNDWINFSRELQDYALEYFTALLEHENPYTGMAYKDDPALAVVEMQNESNVFFHTINEIWEGKPAVFTDQISRDFHAFVREKYGSRAAVEAAWDGRWVSGDDWDGGSLRLAAPYHWGADGPAHQFSGQFRRVGDFIEFLAAVQREYYERRYRDIRELGYEGVIVTTAWKAVGSSSLANLWADTAGDMIDRHNYFGGGAGGHRITEGEVRNHTHLDRPGRGLLSLGLFQVEGMPFGVSEWSMTPPAPYKAEAAPLMAFYGLGLQGWDASYHFATSAQRLGDGWPGLGKYVSGTPHYLGQFPALAFAVHHGHIQEGDVVALRRVSDEQAYSGRDELGQSLANDSHDYKDVGDQVATAPEFLGIGRVTLAFEDGDSEIRDPAEYWDREAEVVTSTTGELVWRYGDRVVEVRTPKTQAIIGFAGGETIELPGVTVAMETEFASLIFTPLDDRPLAESEHILVTAMARDKQTGSVFNEDWSELRQVGGPPLLMEPVQATITLRGAAPSQVRPLDIYGVPREVDLDIDEDGSFHIDGTAQTYYYEIRR